MKLRTSIVAPLTIIAALAAVPSGYAANELTGRSSPRSIGFGDCPPTTTASTTATTASSSPTASAVGCSGRPGRRCSGSFRCHGRRPGRSRRRGAPGAVLGARFRSCVSRRHFTIRIRQRNGARIAKASVILRSKAIKTVKGKRVTAPMVLRGLPKGTFSLRSRAVTAEGKVLNGTRTYHTCAAKKRSHVPTL